MVAYLSGGLDAPRVLAKNIVILPHKPPLLNAPHHYYLSLWRTSCL